MEMHQIRYFLAVCDTMNFTRAAEHCHVSQPSLTQAIKKLEEELGGALFIRERQRTRLTELGTLMRPMLEQVLAGTQTAKARAHHFIRLEKAPLQIGVMITIGPLRLASFLTHLQREYPGLEIELHEGTEDVLLKRLMTDDLDAVVTAPLHDLGSLFAVQTLYTEPYVVVFPPGHRFETHETVRLRDLTGEPYLDRLSCELRDMVTGVCYENDVTLYARYRSEREDWIQGMVMAGLGVAFMPAYSIVVDGIGKRPLVEPEVSRHVKAVVLADKAQAPSPAVRTLQHEMAAWHWT